MDKIIKLRNKLENDHKEVKVRDFKYLKDYHYSISTIYKIATIPHFYGMELYYIVKQEKPIKCLEFGTSLGVSASYICEALQPKAKLITIEGNKVLADIAKENLKDYNCEVINKTFDEAIKDLNDTYDFVFIDGHHNKEVLKYYNAIKKKTVIFDDINWSDEMQEVWDSLEGFKLTIGNRFGVIKP